MGVLIDADLHIPIYSPTCVFCRYLNRERGDRSCAAYPEVDSIPMDIWMGQNDHRTPRAGDHGIQFAPHTIASAADAAVSEDSHERSSKRRKR